MRRVVLAALALAWLPAWAQSAGISLVGGGYYSDPGDTAAPEAITDLAAATNLCVLSWTAPHEDGNTGDAVSGYDCRLCPQSTCGLTMDEAEYAVGIPLSGEPVAPNTPGEPEGFTTTSFISMGTPYVLACKSRDDVSNVSPVSNSAPCNSISLDDLMAETFDATGYDLDACGTQPECWLPTGANGTTILIEPDHVVTAGSPVNGVTGFSGQALRIVANTDYAAPTIEYELPVDQTGNVYCGVNFYIEVEALVNDETATIIKLDDNTAPGSPQGFSGGDGAVTIQLRQVAGQLELAFKTGSGAEQYTENVAVGTGYRLEWRVNTSGHDTEFRINDVTIDPPPLDTGDPQHNVQRIRLGLQGPGAFPTRIFFDRLSCGTLTWMGP